MATQFLRYLDYFFLLHFFCFFIAKKKNKTKVLKNLQYQLLRINESKNENTITESLYLKPNKNIDQKN